MRHIHGHADRWRQSSRRLCNKLRWNLRVRPAHHHHGGGCADHLVSTDGLITNDSTPDFAGTAVGTHVTVFIGTAFALVVLPTGIGVLEVEDLGVWTVVLLGFAAVTMSLWAILRFTGSAVSAPDESELVTPTVES